MPLRSLALVLTLLSVSPAGVVAEEYTLGPGDVLRISVWGQDDLSKEYQIAPEGSVSFPLIGKVPANGMTTAALAERLRALLEKDYLVNPQVAVTVREYLSQKVHVMGEAEKPGLYYLTGPTTLVELISKAGVSKTAGREVLVVRAVADAVAGSSNILRFDLGKMQAGDSNENLTVQRNDLVLIPKALARSFFVFGEVRKPGSYPFEKDINVLEAITIAGGLTDKAAAGRTRIIRNTSKGQEILHVDVNDLLKRGQGEKGVRLLENDVVVVPESFF